MKRLGLKLRPSQPTERRRKEVEQGMDEERKRELEILVVGDDDRGQTTRSKKKKEDGISSILSLPPFLRHRERKR